MFRIYCLLLYLLIWSNAIAQDKRPNILLFITDDESWLERSAYGLSKLPTPNFDRVAKKGILFTNAYTSAPSCAPSRAALLTGRNFWELKQGAFIQAWLPREFPILTVLLKESGYNVGITGKAWGPGTHPKEGYSAGLGSDIYNKQKLSADQQLKDISPLDYSANFREFLGSSPQKPFFFWYGTSEPHDPHAPDNWMRLEKDFGIDLSKILVPSFMGDDKITREKRANMAYEICYADKLLGEALDMLEKEDKLKNTIVIVTADNGTVLGEKGKASPYVSGTHVPLAIMWPERIKAGRTVTDFINFSDFAPTILEASKSRALSSMSGKSFMNVLISDQSGKIDNSRNFTVTGLEWHGETDPDSRSFRSIITEKYTYIVRFSNDKPDESQTKKHSEILSEELYDLSKDPWQQSNLFEKVAYKDVLTRLKQKLVSYCTETGDPRFIGDMTIFRSTRKLVQDRKKNGYKDK